MVDPCASKSAPHVLKENCVYVTPSSSVPGAFFGPDDSTLSLGKGGLSTFVVFPAIAKFSVPSVAAFMAREDVQVAHSRRIIRRSTLQDNIPVVTLNN